MEYRDIRTADFSGQSVCIRAGFDVSVDSSGQVSEPYRLSLIKESVDLVLSFPHAKVALLTHQGRPHGVAKPEFSTKALLPSVAAALGREVVFVPDCQGEKVSEALANLSPGTIALLENVRFYKGEEEDNQSFAEALARPFQSYINEAFSNSHRKHASMSALARLLPAYPGLHLLKELAALEKVKTAPQSPAVAIIGGAKIETKVPLIRAFEKNYDRILIGGKIANEALDEGISFSDRVLLPVDFDSEQRLDIGPLTIEKFKEALSGARTIVWNGPMGKFEEPPYDKGTKALFEAIRTSSAYSVVGGGETVAVIQEADAFKDFSFVSSGGGAMLSYLSGAVLPGLEALAN